MLMLLPIAAFTLFFLVIWTSPSDEASPDWRKAFLQAAVLWGVVLVAITEGLSLGHALTAAWVAVSWVVAAVVAAVWAIRSGGIARRWARIPRSWLAPDWVSLVILVGMAGIVVCLLVVAWVSPPNNTDSLQYHMSRVMHWAQDASLRHFPTAFEPQLWQPIWAESAILNLRVLWGSDRPANLIQWFSMVGSLIGVSLLAKSLGAGIKGQLAAAAFALSIPIGILESTSTQNDYVAAFWLVCLAYFVLQCRRDPDHATSVLAIGSALGLGLLTKGTFYPYAFPFVVWFAGVAICRTGLTRGARAISVVAIVVLLLNAGYWTRNIITYGGPLGSSETIGRMAGGATSPSSLPAAIVSNVALNFASPSESLNARLSQAIDSFAKSMGGPTGGLSLTFIWNFEDLAGNPIHMALVPITLLVIFLARKKIVGRDAWRLAGLLCLSYVTLAAAVRFDAYGVRYQTPFLVAWAPVFGVAAGMLERRTAGALAVCLVLASLPWVFFNRTRPMIGWRPRTSTDSIFRTPASELLFVNWIERRDSSIAAAAAVEATGCKQVGLRLDSHDWEYSFWWLLRAPQSGIRLEVLNARPALQRYSDPAFHPCVVICTICGSRARVHGLDLKVAFSDVRVYVGDGFVPEEGE